MRSPPEHDVNTANTTPICLFRDAPDSLREKGAVQRDDLRNVRDGVLGEPGRAPRQKDVPRRFRPLEIAGERYRTMVAIRLLLNESP